MKQQIWIEDYRINSYLVNLRGQAGLYAILNLVQDVGWQHAIHLQVKLDKNLAWVFTRQKLIMNQWPKWNEIVTMKTWLRPTEPGSPFILRDYEIYIADKKIGQCTSTFTVMDMNTRKLAPQTWNQFDDIWLKQGHLEIKPGKILWSDKVNELSTFEVRNSDIDLNQHVNNTKYANWILDALPIDVLKGGVELKEYEVNFLSEAKLGDHVILQQVIDDNVIQFQGARSNDSKPIFTACMRVE